MSLVDVPKTDVQMGGPSAEPSPAWFRDDLGIVWVRCFCSELIKFDLRIYPELITDDGHARLVHECGANDEAVLVEYERG